MMRISYKFIIATPKTRPVIRRGALSNDRANSTRMTRILVIENLEINVRGVRPSPTEVNY